MKTFLITLKGYALSIDCEDWEQAEDACKSLEAELQGELLEVEYWDYDPERVIN